MQKMRLQKFLAHSGVASRRAAEKMIQNGRVSINGNVTKEMGTVVDENDIVEVDGRIVKTENNKLYIMLNKPVGYVTTSNDQFSRPIVLDLISGIHERIYPVGRLDYDTSGLLLLTNDGDFTYSLTHPRHEVKKVYEACLKGIPTPEEIKSFENGLEIDDYITSPALLKIKRTMNDMSIAEITIHEGRNRQVRKMCDSIGHKVLSLKRIAIGPLTLGDLKEGQWHKLSEDEISLIYDKNL